MQEYMDYDKERMIMVGDRMYDIVSANNIGINSVGVLYGYGSLEEIKDANPTYTANNVEELKDILLD